MSQALPLLKLTKRHIFIYMAASKLHDPPSIEDLHFCSNFSLRETAQKSRGFCRDSVGARQKSKDFWKKPDSTWSGNFSDQKSPCFQWENGSKWPKVAKTWHAKKNHTING